MWFGSIPQKRRGAGPTSIPFVAAINHSIAQDYGMLKEEDNTAYRGLFIVDNKLIERQDKMPSCGMLGG